MACTVRVFLLILLVVQGEQGLRGDMGLPGAEGAPGKRGRRVSEKRLLGVHDFLFFCFFPIYLF